MSELPASASQQTEAVPQQDRLRPLSQILLRDNFDAFYVAEKKHVTAFLMYVGASAWEADDLAHEALMKLLPVEWMSIEHPRAWLRQVTCRAYWKQHQRNREDVTEMLPDLPGGLCPVTEVELSEQTSRIIKATRQLPAVQRAVMAFVLHGADTKEISDALNMKEAAVRTNLCRARRRMKEILGLEEGENDA